LATGFAAAPGVDGGVVGDGGDDGDGEVEDEDDEEEGALVLEAAGC